MSFGRRIRTWWQQLISPKRPSRANRKTNFIRLAVEPLESRDCPAAEPSSPRSLLNLPSATASGAAAPIAITRPTTITRPGYYQLQNNLVITSGVGITIAASDVTIDLNGFSITGPGTANNQAIGIYAINQDRITIRNGSINNLFYGIYLSDNADYVTSRNGYFDQGGHRIEDITFYGNTFRALRVEGIANVIRHNVFQDTGGTSVYRPAYVAAIETYGPGTVIEDNIIYNIRGSGYGILVSNLGAGTTIQENIITATSPAPHPSFSAAIEGLADNAWTWAIAVQGPTTNAIVAANTIANFDFGIAYLVSAKGLITNNVVENTNIPFFAPSGAGPVVLAPDNVADRLNFIVASADGLITGNGIASVLPAPRSSPDTSTSTNGSAVRNISSPTVITRPGYYRLTQDISITSGVAIEIQADDVYLDLNGHTLYGPGTANTSAIGIYAANRSRIHITNGSIVGFQYGVYLAANADLVVAGREYFGSGWHLVEKIHFLGNTFRAIRVEGRGNIVRDNILEDTGGSNVYRPAFIAGIETVGPGTVVLNNHVYALRGQGASIYVNGLASGAVVQGNSITQADISASNLYPAASEGLVSGAETWGIRIDSPQLPIIVRNNLVANFIYGIGLPSNGSGLLAENLVTGSRAPYYAIGNNVLVANNNYADTSPSVVNSPTNYASGNGNPARVARPAVALAPNQVFYINSPTTITRPGIYVLSGDIVYRNASGAAITVAASNVTIDLNGYSIIGPGTASNSALGIYARNQDRITIRNGTISGFQYGIYISNDSDAALSGSGFNKGGHLIEGMKLIGNTFRGLRVEGRGNVVRNNIVEDTGGTTAFANPIVVGIESLGPGALIEGNYVYAIRGHGYGIAISGLGGGTVIRGNALSNSALAPTWAYRPGTDGVIPNANTYGIWVGDRNGEVVASDNNIINFAVGIGWHPNSGGILGGNNVTESRVAYYLPGRPNPRVVYAPTNESDDPSSPRTVESDILPPATGAAPPLAVPAPSGPRFVQWITRPTVITRPGIYILATDLLAGDGRGIVVRASDVVIDLNGHTIYGPNTASTRSIGIYVDNQNRVTIRNGTIVGFLYGVLVAGDVDSVIANRTGFASGGHVIEGLRLVNNKFRGIRVEGRGNVIRGNVVINTGGTNMRTNAYALGIDVIGPGALVQDNIVYNTYGMGLIGEGVGISASSVASGTIIKHNVVANSGLTQQSVYAPWPGTSWSTWGVWVGDTATSSVTTQTSNLSSGLITENKVANYYYGITIHPWSQGLQADNAAIGDVVPFYVPVRDVQRATATDTNQADKSLKIFTAELNY